MNTVHIDDTKSDEYSTKFFSLQIREQQSEVNQGGVNFGHKF